MMHTLPAILVLTGIHALLVMAEYALVKTASRMSDENVLEHTVLARILGNLEEHLLGIHIVKTGLLIGIGVQLAIGVGNATSSIGESGWTLSNSGESGLWVLILIWCVTHSVLAEEVPRRWGIMHAESAARLMSHGVRLIHGVLLPLLWFVRECSTALARWRI